MIKKKFCSRKLYSEAIKVVEGGILTGQRMTSTKFDQIIFTGSTATGKHIARAAAANLTPCLLELGGKSPMIVDKSSDVEFAAMKAAFGAFFNSGQTCIRPDYVLVDESIKD